MYYKFNIYTDFNTKEPSCIATGRVVAADTCEADSHILDYLKHNHPGYYGAFLDGNLDIDFEEITDFELDFHTLL